MWTYSASSSRLRSNLYNGPMYLQEHQLVLLVQRYCFTVFGLVGLNRQRNAPIAFRMHYGYIGNTLVAMRSGGIAQSDRTADVRTLYYTAAKFNAPIFYYLVTRWLRGIFFLIAHISFQNKIHICICIFYICLCVVALTKPYFCVEYYTYIVLPTVRCCSSSCLSLLLSTKLYQVWVCNTNSWYIVQWFWLDVLSSFIYVSV